MATPVRVNALSTTVLPVKMNAGAGIVALTVYNPSNAVAYLQIFDAEIPNDVTLGTTLPTWVIPVKTIDSVTLSMDPKSAWFRNGIQVAATTTATGSSAPSVALDVAFALD